MKIEEWDISIKKKTYEERNPWTDGPRQPLNPWLPVVPTTAGKTTCPKCGMTFEGATSYYCVDINCPLFAKAIS